MVRSDSIDQFLTSLQVIRVCTPVKLVLQSVFNFTFEVTWDVIPVSDISDSGEWHRCSELVSETWQICLDTADNEAVYIVCQRHVKCLINVVCNIGVVIRTEMSAVFCARDLARAYEVEVGGESCKTLHLKALSFFVLMYELRNDFKFLLPSASFTIHLAQLTDELI